MSFRPGLLLLLGLLLVAGPGRAPGQEPAGAPPSESAGAAQAAKGAKPQLPGVGEVVPRLAQLTADQAQIQAQIGTLAGTGSFQVQLDGARTRQQDLHERMVQLGDPANWNSDRLLEMRSRLADQQDLLNEMMKGLSEKISGLELIRQGWERRREFWQSWEKALRQSQLKLPPDAFNKAGNIVGHVLAQIGDAFSPLVKLQEEVTTLTEKNLGVLNSIEAILNSRRGEIFTRNSEPFTGLSYYRQFNEKLREQLLQGLAGVQVPDAEFLRDHWGLILLQVVVFLLVACFILFKGRRAEVTPEWQFIIRHPWATGIFSAISALSFLYTTPPALWRLGLVALSAISAAILISGLLKNPRKIFMVNLLAVLFVVSMTLQIIGLPQPLYRLYLALVSLAGIPLLLVLAARNRKSKEGRSDGFTIALRTGAAVLVFTFICQVGGYSALASRVIEASVETVFLVLFAAMAIRLGRGALDYFLAFEFFRNRRFFRRFGDELASRLKTAFEAFVAVYTLLYLLVTWRLYDSVGESWHELTDFSFPWGETRVSVQMILFVILVLYLSILFSWFVRALLEAELFPRRGFDRGVRDSIKKLLHYALMFVGFMIAMSMVGIDLKNFTVLAGAFGIGIGFGLQNIINNFVSGIILLFERPVKVGDVIVMDEEWGTVRKIGLRSTILETLDQSEIIVPNSDLISEKVTNWTLSTRVARVTVTVGVAYGSDVPLVLSILNDTAQGHPDVLADPPHSVLFTEFGDSSLDFELRVWIADVGKRLTVKSDLCQAIDRRFREEGVEIPFPQRDLHLRSVDPAAWPDPGSKFKESENQQ